MRTFILAFDPGRHTGIAEFHDGDLVSTETLVADGYKLKDKRVVYALLRERIKAFVYTCWKAAPAVYEGTRTPLSLMQVAVVIESFHSMQSLTADGIFTVQTAGWLVGECLLQGLETHVRTPASRRTFEDVANNYPSKTKHERDAVAHALSFMCEHGIHWNAVAPARGE